MIYKKVGLRLVVPAHVAQTLSQRGVPIVTRDEAKIAARYTEGSRGTPLFGPRGEKLSLNHVYRDILSNWFKLTNVSLFKRNEVDLNFVLQLWFAPANDVATEFTPTPEAMLIVADELGKRRPVHVYINPDGSAVIDAPCPGTFKNRPGFLRMDEAGEFYIQAAEPSGVSLQRAQSRI